MFAYIATPRPDLLDSGRLKALIDALSGESNDIFGRVVHEGMAGFFFRAIESAQLSGVLPSDQMNRIRREYYATVRKNLTLEHELRRILEATNPGGLDIVILQGMALIHTVYTDVGVRAMTDIDLWVRKKDRRECFDILKRLGYKQDPLYPGTFRNGPAVLDIHSHLFWADRIRSRKRILSVDENRIFEAADPMHRDFPGAMVLNPYDQVLYLGLHMLKHHADRLVWLVDIKLILDRYDGEDWQRLIERAQALGLARSLAYVICLLSRLLRYFPPRRSPTLWMITAPASASDGCFVGEFTITHCPTGRPWCSFLRVLPSRTSYRSFGKIYFPGPWCCIRCFPIVRPGRRGHCM